MDLQVAVFEIDEQLFLATKGCAVLNVFQDLYTIPTIVDIVYSCKVNNIPTLSTILQICAITCSTVHSTVAQLVWFST